MTNEKRAARAIQARTGWSYSECLRLVRMRATEAEIARLIAERGGVS